MHYSPQRVCRGPRQKKLVANKRGAVGPRGSASARREEGSTPPPPSVMNLCDTSAKQAHTTVPLLQQKLKILLLLRKFLQVLLFPLLRSLQTSWGHAHTLPCRWCAFRPAAVHLCPCAWVWMSVCVCVRDKPFFVTRGESAGGGGWIWDPTHPLCLIPSTAHGHGVRVGGRGEGGGGCSLSPSGEARLLHCPGQGHCAHRREPNPRPEPPQWPQGAASPGAGESNPPWELIPPL